VKRGGGGEGGGGIVAFSGAISVSRPCGVLVASMPPADRQLFVSLAHRGHVLRCVHLSCVRLRYGTTAYRVSAISADGNLVNYVKERRCGIDMLRPGACSTGSRRRD